MNKYAIYCTESQTKKALELGAQITLFSDSGYIPQESVDNWHLCLLGNNAYIIPTAEEMIGWLATQKVYVDVTKSFTGNDLYNFEVIIEYDNEYETVKANEERFPRKETTIAAIDAALEYLSNNKK